MTDKEKKHCIDRWKEGAAVPEIAHEIGYNRQSVRKFLVREGVYDGRRIGPRREIVDYEGLPQMAQDYEDGFTYREIAERHGINIDQLPTWLQYAGVELGRRDQSFRDPDHPPTRRLTPQGYILMTVKREDPYYSFFDLKRVRVLEHRYVMTKHLNRPLLPSETVHHINGVRHDNRIENLQLRQGRHGNGVKMICANCGSHEVRPVPLD